MIETTNLVLIVFVFLTAIAALRVQELVSAIFLLGAYSFFIALLWATLGALDVSFTEAMVGVGASTIFMILGLFRAKRHVAKAKPSRVRGYALALIILIAGFFVWGSMDLPAFGNAQAAANAYLSPYYLINSIKDMHTPNAVTAIVVDYRGFDTLIETAVIFTAAVSCLVIMKEKI